LGPWRRTYLPFDRSTLVNVSSTETSFAHQFVKRKGLRAVNVCTHKPQFPSVHDWYGRGSTAGDLWHLERNAAVLARRIRIPLGAQQVERRDDALARLARIDHGVDEAELGRLVRVRELAAVLAHELGARSRLVGCGIDLLLVDDVHRALRAHHGDLGGRV